MKLKLSIGLVLIFLFLGLCSCEDVEDGKSSSSVFARFSSAFSSSAQSSSSLASSSALAPLDFSSTSVDSVSSSSVAVSSSLAEISSSSSVVESADLCASESSILCDLRDGKRYRTVKIGNQVWMAQNLNFVAEGSWCYEGKEANCLSFGRLYTWASALALPDAFLSASAKDSLVENRRGICPEGWHIPANSEMKQLHSFVRKRLRTKSDSLIEGVGTSLKTKAGWEESDEAPAGSDRFGFSAMPAGYRNSNGRFDYLGQDGNFWIAEETSNPTHATYWNLYFANEDFLGVYNNSKAFAYSVRCLKNSVDASNDAETLTNDSSASSSSVAAPSAALSSATSSSAVPASSN